MSIQLPPEIEAGLVAEAASRGVPVESVLSEALDLYMKRKGPPPSRTMPYNGRYPEMAWVRHPDLRYVGQWVVLEGTEVVAHSTDGKTAYDAARAKGIDSPFMFFVAEPDPRPFFAGWLGVD